MAAHDALRGSPSPVASHSTRPCLAARPTSRRSRSGIAGAIPTLLCLLAAACAERPSPGEDWPEGALLVARTPALARLLVKLEELEGTPIARRARALARGLPSCEIVEGRAPGGSLARAVDELSCRPPRSELEALDHERGDRDLAFALPLEGGVRLLGAAALGERGDLEIELRLPRGAFADARALLVPGSKTPGPPVLSASENLIHLRVRPDGGLNLAGFVADHSQADQLFRLKSELFAGAVLDGTWEGAIYPPAEGRPMPRAALALGFTVREAAVAAMERFAADLRASWPVRRSFFAVGDATGACLFDLNILPDFAPCYVATGDALVVGWNPSSVRKALDGGGSDDLGEFGGAVVELARFAEADATLGRGAGSGETPLSRRYPWRRLVADGRPIDDEVHLRVRLESGVGG